MQTLQFKTSVDFRHWLEKNHVNSEGIWLRIFKKDSHEKSVTYAEALDQALCYGWIDGQKETFDKLSWLQKFTPRNPKSGWSKINTQHVEHLIKAGKMTPAGMEAVEAAKADGRWETAYASSRDAIPPEDFLKELSKKIKGAVLDNYLNRVEV